MEVERFLDLEWVEVKLTGGPKGRGISYSNEGVWMNAESSPSRVPGRTPDIKTSFYAV